MEFHWFTHQIVGWIIVVRRMDDCGFCLVED